MRKPNVFIVGFAKCGTTTLANLLSKHSSINMPSKKELHYFESKYEDFPLNGPGDRKSPEIQSLDDYLSFYKGASEPYLIDATPAYIVTDGVEKDLFEFNNEAKIIIMIRNPVQRCFSNYKHLVRDGKENLDFNNALKAEEERQEKNWSQFWRYKDNSLYHDRIKKYYDLFGKKNVKVIITEEFKESQEVVVDNIIDWLDLQREHIYSEATYNKSGAPNAILRTVNTLKKVRLLNRIGKSIISKERFERFKNHNLQTIKMDEEVNQSLMQLFEDDIKQTERLINKDLSDWYRRLKFNNYEGCRYTLNYHNERSSLRKS